MSNSDVTARQARRRTHSAVNSDLATPSAGEAITEIMSSLVNQSQGRTQKFPLEWATRGWVWGGDFPLPSGERSGEGLCPSPEKFSFLTMEMVHSDALFDTFRHCL